MRYGSDFEVQLPSNDGIVVEQYKNVLATNTEYDAWTINDKLELVKCKGIIKNNGSYDNHNNHDDSEDELYVVDKHETNPRWWTLNREEAVRIHLKNVELYLRILDEERSRVEGLIVTR